MNATAMRFSAMPSEGIGSLSHPVPEPQKQAVSIKARFYPTEVLSAAISTRFPRSWHGGTVAVTESFLSREIQFLGIIAVFLSYLCFRLLYGGQKIDYNI